MAVKKYLADISGVTTEEAAVDTTAGAGDAGKIVALNTSGVLGTDVLNAVNSSAGAGDAGKTVILDSGGRIDSTMMPTGVGADSKQITASEALSAGDLVNIHISSGIKVRKADATTSGKSANGFVTSSVSNGATATVYFDGANTGVSGLTAGTKYYLSTTAGGVTSTAPSSSGNVRQYVGMATASGELNFQEGEVIVKA